MSITKILSEDKTPAEDKLDRVAEVVATARSAYGNEDESIESPSVQTPNGMMKFVHLEDESKVAVLRAELGRIKAQAVEFVEQGEGRSMNRKIEELLATNGMFVNISAGTKFEYI